MAPKEIEEDTVFFASTMTAPGQNGGGGPLGKEARGKNPGSRWWVFGGGRLAAKEMLERFSWLCIHPNVSVAVT